MRSILSIAIMLALARASLGQPAPDTLWTRTYGGANRDIAYSIDQTTDGGFILAGVTESFGAGNRDFYLVKTDSQGDTLWTRTYGGSGADVARSVQQTTDGGYVMAGWTTSFGAGYDDFYLVKTDAQGDTLWTRTYGGPGAEGAYSVQQTADGGYIIAGNGGGVVFYVVKTDESGNMIWTHTYDEGSWGCQAYSVQQTADGGYIVVGTACEEWDHYIFVVKTNSSGDTLWTRTYGETMEDYGHSVQQTAEGGYIIAGRTGIEGWDVYLVKTDSSGDTLWTRVYDGQPGDDWASDWAHSVQQTTDGGYIVAGVTESVVQWVADMYLVRTDANGDTLWARTYGGSSDDCAYSVQQTMDGGYVAAGYTSSFGAGAEDFYLVRTKSDNKVGYVTLISPRPPDWGYRLHWVSGSLSRLTFTNFCSGTEGSVSGDAEAAGWVVTNYSDSIVFATALPLTSGSIDTFWLSHPYCSDYVTWQVGDSIGAIEGPLPVELTTFEAIAGDGQVTLRWHTASEQDNDHFVLYKRRSGQEDFNMLAEIRGQGTTTEPHDYVYVDRWVQNGVTYQYQISDVDIAGRETIHETIVSATPTAVPVPADFALHAPYPNPFNPTTLIGYDVKETGLVSVKVFDLLGREVATLVQGTVPAGSYSIDWHAGDLPSGLYFCRMEADGFARVRKLLLVK